MDGVAFTVNSGAFLWLIPFLDVEGMISQACTFGQTPIAKRHSHSPEARSSSSLTGAFTVVAIVFMVFLLIEDLSRCVFDVIIQPG